MNFFWIKLNSLKNTAWLDFEDILDIIELSCCGLHPAEGGPVVGDDPGADEIGASVDSGCPDGDLHQIGQLGELLHGAAGVEQPSFVVEPRVCPNERVPPNGGSEDLDSEHVLDDLLCVPVELGVDDRWVVVAGNAVAQSRDSVLDLPDPDGVGKGVPQCEQLLVPDGHRDQQAVLVPDGHPADDAHPRDSGVDHWDVLLQLLLEGGEEVLCHVAAHQAVAVRQQREGAHLAGGLESCSMCHFYLYIF